MGDRKLFMVLLFIVIVLAVVQSGKYNGNACKNKKIEYTKEQLILFQCGRASNYNCSCHNEIIPGYFEGKYVQQGQCKNNKASSETSHTVIGFGATVALLSILLLIAIGGWISTCWIMRKTTEISIQPKSNTRVIHQYAEHPQPDNNGTLFQPSVKYSLLDPSYNSQLSQLSRSEMEEEQIYEVLDEEDNHLQKAKARGVNRGVIISGDKNGPYSKLEYSENSQSN